MDFRKSIALAACAATLAQSVAAIPVTYNFIQHGFLSHAYVFGSFTGDDLNHDGQIISYNGEVFALNATFTGSADVAGFTIASRNPNGSELVYTVGTEWIGDDSGNEFGGEQEYIWFGQGDFYTGVYHQYLTGYYIQDNFCRSEDFICGEVDYFYQGVYAATDATSQFARVSRGVPEPQNWVLLIAGFGLTGAVLRRRSRRSARAPQ